MLDCAVSVRRGDFELQARFTASTGSLLAVVGPNGSGKSTLLRGLAGLVPVAGSVTVDGHEQAATPVHRRAVGWVPQQGALFPHLSARDNVAFGLGDRAGRRTAQEMLDRLGVGGLAHRRPDQLSGGQAQKVAIARAMARRPRLLLLDEPFAALDVAARAEVRRTLRALLDGFDGVTLLVTHDPVDVVTLADRVIALQDGRVVQDAAAAEVARAPRSPWLAELVGSNAWPGVTAGRSVSLAGGGSLTVAEQPAADGTAVLAVVPAHAVTLHLDRPTTSARNCWPVAVTDLVATGSRVRVRCAGPPDVFVEVTPTAVTELSLVEGASVWASIKATEVAVVPA